MSNRFTLFSVNFFKKYKISSLLYRKADIRYIIMSETGSSNQKVDPFEICDITPYFAP